MVTRIDARRGQEFDSDCLRCEDGGDEVRRPDNGKCRKYKGLYGALHATTPIPAKEA